MTDYSTNRRTFLSAGAAACAAIGSGLTAAAAGEAAPQSESQPPPSPGRVVVYPAPEGEVLSEDYTVEVNGHRAPVYAIQSQWHDKKYSAAYFDSSGAVTVKIKPNVATLKTAETLEGLAIRPAHYGIEAKVANGEAIFTTDRHFNISFEPTGQKSPLHLFSSPIETNAPKQGDPNVIYFGPGIHKPTRIDLTAGQTLYIAGGAIVKSAVTSTGDNIRIMGRGILCGNDWPHSKGPTARMVWPADGRNIVIEDIIIRGAWNWTIAPSRCDQVLVQNVRICGSRCGNDDGVDPCNASNVTVRGCFIHTDDDGIAVKGAAWTGQDPKPAENIVVEDCTFWIDFANVFRIGAESRARGMRNIVARNIDVIHFPNRAPVDIFLIHPMDNMPMENLSFEDIRINGEQPLNLIRLTPMSPDTRRPRTLPRFTVAGNGPYIHNVTFKNIEIYGNSIEGAPAPRIVLTGLSEKHDVTHVSFDNVTRYGRLVTADSENVHLNEFVSEVKFNGMAARPAK